MEGARGKILEEPAREGKAAGRLGIEGEGQQGEGKHGGRAGRPDVEAEHATLPGTARLEDDLAGPHLVAAELPSAEESAGTRCLQVLGSQAGLFAPRPDATDSKGLP